MEKSYSEMGAADAAKMLMLSSVKPSSATHAIWRLLKAGETLSGSKMLFLVLRTVRQIACHNCSVITKTRV